LVRIVRKDTASGAIVSRGDEHPEYVRVGPDDQITEMLFCCGGAIRKKQEAAPKWMEK
jgi:hypothetical protein